jgi:hypothetical protein
VGLIKKEINMEKNCGNCKHWQTFEIGFPLYCTNPVASETMNKLSTNNPNFTCNYQDLNDDIKASLIQYPARFVEKP